MAIEHLVHNERVELRAALANGVAIAAFVAAFVQAIFFDAIGSLPGGYSVLPLVGVMTVLGAALPLIAWATLGQLREKTSEEGTP